MPKAKPSSKKPKKIRHYAQVVRFKIETAYVEFNEIEDEDKATDRAVKLAKALPESAWREEAVPQGEYAPFVRCVMTETDVERERASLPPGETLEEPRELVDVAEYYRYVLLSADVHGGDGDVVLQPWLIVDRPDLMASDIVNDWIWCLQSLGIEHMGQRVDEMMRGGAIKPSDKILFAQPPTKKAPTKRKGD